MHHLFSLMRGARTLRRDAFGQQATLDPYQEASR